MNQKFKLGLDGIAVLIGSYIVASLILAVYTIANVFILKEEVATSMALSLVSFVLSLGLPIAAFDIFIVRPQTKKPLRLGVGNVTAQNILLSLIMMIGMVLMAEVLTSFIPTEGGILGELYNTFMGVFKGMLSDKVGLAIMVVCLAPLLEEVLFRGIIQGGLTNKGIAPKKAIVISALVFGIVHANPWQLVGAFLLGLVLGLVYFKTKSIVIPILLHAFNNFISYLMLVYADTEHSYELLGINKIVSFIIGMVIFGVAYYLFMHRKTHFTK